jgi:hypothetical protein
MAEATLRDALISKYGPPSVKDPDGDKWLTKSTVIELSTLRSEGAIMAVFISYSKRDSEPGL